jgi:ComF family protein
MRGFADTAALLRRAERWLLPGACLLCQDPVGDGDTDPLICSLCLSRFRRLPQPCCERCGQPQAGPVQPCRVCVGWPSRIGPVRSAVWLDDLARSAVHQLKYAGWPRVTDALARLMVPLVSASPGAVLVPIPLASGRARRRGYNQAECLAKSLGAISGLPVRGDLLRRVRETTTQTALAPEARQANVAEAFVPNDVAEREVILVDDVFTTGATLCAAALGLLEGGAETVGAVTFARALPPSG